MKKGSYILFGARVFFSIYAGRFCRLPAMSVVILLTIRSAAIFSGSWIKTKVPISRSVRSAGALSQIPPPVEITIFLPLFDSAIFLHAVSSAAIKPEGPFVVYNVRGGIPAICVMISSVSKNGQFKYFASICPCVVLPECFIPIRINDDVIL